MADALDAVPVPISRGSVPSDRNVLYRRKGAGFS